MSNITRRNVLSATAAAMLPASIARAAVGTPVRADEPVRLLANENPYGPSPAARAAATSAVARSWRYAFREQSALKSMIAEREGLPAESVLITAGSSEGLRLAALLYCRPGSELVSAHPTFPFLPSYAATLGASVKAAPLTPAMELDLDAMSELVTPETSLAYVCNPNNPTGVGLPGRAVAGFIAGLRENVPVVVDEAYVELAADPGATTVLDRVKAGDPVIITRTFSKLHGLAGLRIGYVMAPPEVISAMTKLRMTMANVVSMETAIASYGDLEFQAFSRARIEEGKEVVYRLCRTFERPFTPSEANFVLMQVGTPVDEFRQFMRQRNLLVGREYDPYRGWCRISMGTVEHMNLFASVASEYFSARRS